MLRQILTASGSTFFMLGILLSAGIANAIAPIDIDVPLPQCENGKPRNANNECPGNGDGIFRLPKLAPQRTIYRPTSPRRDLDARGSGRTDKKWIRTTLPDSSTDCTVPRGALPICPFKAQSDGEDPDMGDREGVPPSVGTGTRVKIKFKPPVDNPTPRTTEGAGSR
jgi:hypothetical protein